MGKLKEKINLIFKTKSGNVHRGSLPKESDFIILSSKEERELTTEELKEYYVELREYLLNRKLEVTTPGARTIGPLLKKPTSKIAVAVTKFFTCKDVEWVCDGKENIPEGPAIFAHNHQGILDTFAWIPTLERHCVILHGSEVNKLLLLCQSNTGLVLVKKGDKENNQKAKLDMIQLLLEGHSVVYFPEGTWNLSPNKLLLPMSYGFLDTARKANVPVVPVVNEYTYDHSGDKEKIVKIHTRYGKPIYISPEDDIKEKLEEYETAMATMMFELIEEKGIYNREDITNEQYAMHLKESYKNLALGKLNWEKESKNIFGAGKDPFNHLNEVPLDENLEYVETEETQKLLVLNKKHGIGRNITK